MRLTTIAKLAVVAGLGVCSSMATTRIVAQAKGRYNKGQSTGNRPPAMQREAITKQKLLRQRGADQFGSLPDMTDRNHVASYRLNKLYIFAREDRIFVSAQTTMHDHSEKYQYIWNIKITDKYNNKTIVSHNYDNQIFSLAAGKIYRPTFNDQFPLASGFYRVELRLFKINSNTDLEALKGAGIDDYKLMLAGVRNVKL